MAVVPYTFANQSGQIPLSELDANFANVKAFAETAGNVTGNIQSNITAVGTLTALTVSGNVTAPYFLGNVVGNISGNITVAGSNTQVLFNDSGIANASAGMTFNKVSNLLTVGGIINSGPLNSSGNIVANGKIFAQDFITSNAVVTGDVLHAVSGNIGTPVGVLTLRLGNVNPNTVWIGGNAGNIYLANVNSNTQVSGNLTAGGNLSATGNIQGGNLVTGGLISATGNVQGGNLVTGGLITATGNIQGGNLSIGGLISATGNVQGGNLVTGGLITATGNIQGGNLSIGGTSTLSGVATAPTAANGTSNTQVATTNFVANSLLNLVPTGVIVMWSGSVASIPTGWLLCNGANSTPDLRDRFVVGAGTTYTPGNTGGSANAIVVSHSHTASSSVTDPGHAHTYNDTVLQADYFGTGSNASTSTAGTTSTANTGITVATTVNSTGSSATNANLPPYYALAYIMKA
jgi:hypothetical protein